LSKNIRVLVAKPGLDGHDRGAKVIAHTLRDAGMDVIYTGIRQSPEMIAEAAFQEDVDVVGISILSGAHTQLIREIAGLLQKQGGDNPLLVVGGIIPSEDKKALYECGVSEIFGPGTSTQEIVTFIKKSVNF
tara:strand:- start:3480 stop:3875 length:396 start_codon:yes stop_codon:yes gene_type:complete